MNKNRQNVKPYLNWVKVGDNCKLPVLDENNERPTVLVKVDHGYKQTNKGINYEALGFANYHPDSGWLILSTVKDFRDGKCFAPKVLEWAYIPL